MERDCRDDEDGRDCSEMVVVMTVVVTVVAVAVVVVVLVPLACGMSPEASSLG
jgi:hypothetical protein